MVKGILDVVSSDVLHCLPATCLQLLAKYTAAIVLMALFESGQRFCLRMYLLTTVTIKAVNQTLLSLPQ